MEDRSVMDECPTSSAPAASPSSPSPSPSSSSSSSSYFSTTSTPPEDTSSSTRRKRKASVLYTSPPTDPPPAPPDPPAQLLLPAAWRSGLPPQDHAWLGGALFVEGPKGRPVLRSPLRLWYRPPGPPPACTERPPNPDAFFQRPFIFWAPYRLWRYRLSCPTCGRKLHSCGVYKTVRRVLDVDGWYHMGTEYLECSGCRTKVSSWTESIREQLDVDHQQLFPAVLTYKLCCDKKIMAMMKERTAGSGISWLRSFLVEQHTAEWMRRGTQYLGTLCRLQVPGEQVAPPPALPVLQPVPTTTWLLSAFASVTAVREEELSAEVTSTFGTILKMASTKKVTRKTAGAGARTAECMVSVGNERGQVLICVLTDDGRHAGLRDMARGLQDRYERAGRDPPEVLYVDRGCCGRDGGSRAAAELFPHWPQLCVRLDVLRFLWRLASGVRSVSHPLYHTFMQRLSSSIFEWDAEDVSRLRRATQSDRTRRGRGPNLKEMARHCRRRTRGAKETERLLEETLQAFMDATDTRNDLLLDRERMEDIWRTQRTHVTCIQDPPGVSLYTKTGQVTKRGAVLPVFRCARGTSSLKPFHLHLNRFIPGTGARGAHFQTYLLEGLTRWNADRSQAAAGGAKTAAKCHSSQEERTFNQLTQHFYGRQLVGGHSEPMEYTGELIGVKYLQDVPDEDKEEHEEEEEEEEDEDELHDELDIMGFEDLSSTSTYHHLQREEEEEEEEPTAGPSSSLSTYTSSADSHTLTQTASSLRSGRWRRLSRVT